MNMQVSNSKNIVLHSEAQTSRWSNIKKNKSVTEEGTLRHYKQDLVAWWKV